MSAGTLAAIFGDWRAAWEQVAAMQAALDPEVLATITAGPADPITSANVVRAGWLTVHPDAIAGRLAMMAEAERVARDVAAELDRLQAENAELRAVLAASAGLASGALTALELRDAAVVGGEERRTQDLGQARVGSERGSGVDVDEIPGQA